MVKINLALQGGGSHGAFTWGVLDRLLDDEDLEIVGVSGTSAGAMNGIVLAEGILEGGRPQARSQLEDFWRLVAEAGKSSPLQRTPYDQLRGIYSLDSAPMHIWLDVMSRFFSPYQLNPKGDNPLRPIIEEFVDFERVRASRDVKVFINATCVRTGTLKIFREYECTVDMVLASACLPTLFHAVEIDGELYWDGGYIANPAIDKLAVETGVDDILIVQINPLKVDNPPDEAREIINRIGEITFNSSLIKDIRLIAQKNDLIEAGDLDPAKHRLTRLHMIHGGHELEQFDNSSKFLTEWDFLVTLKELGRRLTDEWLKSHKAELGVQSSLDYRRLMSGDVTAMAAAVETLRGPGGAARALA